MERERHWVRCTLALCSLVLVAMLGCTSGDQSTPQAIEEPSNTTQSVELPKTDANQTVAAEPRQKEPEKNSTAQTERVDVEAYAPELINQLPESQPGEVIDEPQETTNIEAVDMLQGWWIPKGQGEGMPNVYVFDGVQYSAMLGNGNGESIERTISNDDVSRTERDGRQGWVVELGAQRIFVPDVDSDSPVLIEGDSATVLVRGEGALY